MKNKYSMDKIYLVIYLFILMYLPPIIKHINILLPLSAFSLLMIFYKHKNSLKLIGVKNDYKPIIKMIGIYFVWYIFTIIFNYLISGKFYSYNYFINFYSLSLVFIFTAICVLYVFLYCKDKKIEFDELIKLIIIAGLIQAFLAILALISSNVKDFFVETMFKNTGDNLLIHKYNVERRFFGFANNMLDSYGFGTGIIAALPLYLSLKDSKKWLLTVPFLLMVPTLNSRTGLVVFCISTVFYILYIWKNKVFDEFKKIVPITFGVILLFVVSVLIFNPTTIEWIIKDFSSFFTNKFGTFNVLFSERFWKLPNFLGIIIGKGYNIAGFGGMQNIIGFSSDVGYINEIWKTGIIGLSIMCVIFYKITKNMLLNSTKEEKFLVIFITFSFLICNIKFYVISCSLGVTIYMMLVLKDMLNLKEKKYKVKNNELISIIVPIYNVEKYLKKCVDSLINQTYKNIEIILVNDGSPDNSALICEEYAKKDKRIVYILQKNKGLSGARNTGIVNSKGKYLIFVDSDDYVDIHFVEDLYRALLEKNADISVCDYQEFEEGTEPSKTYNEEYYIETYTGKEKYKNLYNNLRTAMTVAWNKLYKREIFEEIKYCEGLYHEDEEIICKILDKASVVAYIDSKNYFYLQRAGSITGNYNLKRKDILVGLKCKMEFLEKKNYSFLYSRALYDYYYQLIYQYMMIKKHYSEEKETLEKIEKEIEELKSKVLKNLFLNPLRKLKVMIYLIKIKRQKNETKN